MLIAAELYPVLEDFKKDPQATLHQLKAIGYTGIEWYGDPIMEASDIRKLIDESGLTLTGAQVPWRLMQGDNLQKVIAYQKALKNQHVLIAALGGPWESGHKVSENTVATWQKHAARINEMNQVFHDAGMTLGYHTHAYDFCELVEGRAVSLDILLNAIDSDVQIEVDTGNCIEGGREPQHELLRLTGRVPFVHCKPYGAKAKYEVALGSEADENDWPAIVNAAKDAGSQWLVVEPESTTLGSPLEIMAQCFEALKPFVK